MPSNEDDTDQDSDSSSEEEMQQVEEAGIVLKEDKPLESNMQLDHEVDLRIDVVDGKEGTLPKSKNNMVLSPGLVGECSACSIQLRDWPSTHEHLRFHRLVHIPECINYLITSRRSRICQICQRSCQTKEVLAYHAYTEHPMQERSLHKCPFCGEFFSTLSDYQDHIDISAITFYCQTCKKSLKSEHKFYTHLCKCLSEHQMEISSVICPICNSTNFTSSSQLSSHLSEHSTLLRETCAKGATSVSRSNPLPTLAPVEAAVTPDEKNDSYRPFLCEMCDRRFVLYTEYKRHMFTHQKARCYVCTHCGKSYCQKNSLIVHLYTYHKAAPNNRENTPVDDINQKHCELCNDSGYEHDDLLIRHAILRCPQRDNLQISFAVIINSISKNLNLSFFETMVHHSFTPYMKLGFEAWSKVPKVKKFLEGLSSKRNCGSSFSENISSSSRKDGAEFTDVQLLEWLSEFEEKHRHQDKELDHLIRMKSKNLDTVNSEAISVTAVPSNKNNDKRGKNYSGFRSPSPAAANVSILPADQARYAASISPYKSRKVEEPPLPDFSRLMSHLQNTNKMNTNKMNANYDCNIKENEFSMESNNTLDICLVTSTMNTQVSITPAGNVIPTGGRDCPNKVSNSLPHKPSVEEIQQQYPGVKVLNNVDFTRIPRLLMEMNQMMDTSVETEMAAAGITAAHIERLHAEAQYLRELEPFYVTQDYHWGQKQDEFTTNRKSKKRKLNIK
ncbi:unnamed protein product, partial [Meganyctiphanes norvegica]